MQRLDTGFSHRSRKAAAGNRRLIAATVAVLLLIVIDIISGGFVRSIVRAGVSGTLTVTHASITRIAESGFFSSRTSLAHENAALSARIAELQERAALSTALQSQLSALSQADHVVATAPGITVPVVSSSIASPYGTFLIGGGSADGIVAGAIVLSAEGTVIGTVSDAGAHSATVLEIFSAGRVTDAIIDGAPLSVRGTGGGNGKTLAPHGVKITEGDAVIAPSFGERPIGIVGHVNSDPSSAATEVFIGTPVNMDALQYVVVAPAVAVPAAAKK